MNNRTMAANQRRRERGLNRPRNSTGNPESQSVPLDPDYWEELGWMGVRADSGVRMNQQQAIGHPPILRAITLVARGTAKLPADIFKRVGNPDDDDWKIDRSHPARKLLRKKASPYVRSYTWRISMMFHALLRGNGYSAILRKGADPYALALLDPVKTEPYWRGDELRYKTEVRGQKATIAAEDMFHLRGICYDGVHGLDILKACSNAMGMGPAGRKWLSKLLSRGSTAGGLLQLPRELSKEARLKRQEEFDKYQSGLDNAFKTMALEDGAKWIRTMITPQEAMILDIMNLDAKMVSNVFGVPGHKLGDTTNAAYNSLEEENEAFLEDSLDPWCIEFEGEASDKLLTTDQNENDTHKVAIDRTAMEVGDLDSQAAAFDKLVNGGLLLPDEARSKMKYPPLPDGQGKKLRISSKVAVDGQLPQPVAPPAGETIPENPETPANPPAAADPKALKNAAHDLVVDRLTRLNKIVSDQLVKVSNKGPEAVADFWRNHRDRVADALNPILPVLAIANGLAKWPNSAAAIAKRMHDEGTLLAGEIQLQTQIATSVEPSKSEN